ncbi:tol-pal system protein YbgF [Vibrio viridaestus]|uniref:Cell division coordinator CpoB n=1 Tax=Vibrio viridaestus TaxID=2487322 RepID=A0A3N9TGA3_9VIBR|nr:tol-pal system protein YbgF [Vibrio viridaestus]RQW63298.1 tol-pal system protein YbgF [Vibrio viridaestus]
MYSNFKRLTAFVLLASAASSVLAAPAPVTDIDSSSSSNSSSQPETALQRLERLLRNQNHVQLQMQQQLDDMTGEIQNLRGQVERNSHDVSQILDRQKELFVELDKLRQQQSAPKAEVTPTPDDTGDSSNYVASGTEQQAYQDAVDLILKKRDYSGAIAAFNKFREDYPDSTFTPNAYYWLGQLYFAQKDNAKAISSFESVLTFKSSNKRADALVKLGDLEERNNNAEKAQAYYKQAVKEYPNSASAKTAKSKLAN